MKTIAKFYLLLPVLMSINCTPYLRGSGSHSSIGSSTTKQVLAEYCFDKDRFIKIRQAASRCLQWKQALPALQSALLEEKEKNINCQASRKKDVLELAQCQKERERAQNKKPEDRLWVGIALGVGIVAILEVVVVGVVVVYAILHK